MMTLGSILPVKLVHGTKKMNRRCVAAGGGFQMRVVKQPKKLAAGVNGIVVKCSHQQIGLTIPGNFVNGILTTSQLDVHNGLIIQESVPRREY